MSDLPDLIKNNISECIGNTPIIKLNNINESENGCILAKCEFLNPGGSIDDRIVNEKINYAYNNELYDKSTTFIDYTSSNIGLSCSISGCNNKIKINSKNTISKTKKKILNLFNHNDNQNSIIESNIYDLSNSYDSNKYYINFAEEIFSQTKGDIDVIFIPHEPEGCISGIANRLKALIPEIVIIGIIVSKDKDYKDNNELGIIPSAKDRRSVDVWSEVNLKNIDTFLKEIISKEGLLCGKISASVIKCAVTYLKEFKLNKYTKCMVILPDHLMTYLSTIK
jgi:cysteine synthase